MSNESIPFEVACYIEEYTLYFNEQYWLLKNRYQRFLEIKEASGSDWNTDLNTYFDMIIVQLRALLLDDSGNKTTGLNNYTVKNILSMAEGDEYTTRVDTLLNTPFIKGVNDCGYCLVSYDCEKNIEGCTVKQDTSIRQALKDIADKTICHYDNYYRKNAHKWEYIQLLRTKFMDDDYEYNLDFVMNYLFDLLKDGIRFEYH